MVFFFNEALAQANIDSIIDTSPKCKKYHYVFPDIKLQNRKVAAKKINTDLRTDFLNLDSSQTNGKDIFRNIKPSNNNPMPAKSDLTFEVLNNSLNVLTISISADDCGAYCEEETEYFSYDLKTGDRIKLENVLSAEGQIELLDSINAQRVRLIREEISKINDTLAHTKHWLSNDDEQYYKDMLDMYSDCLLQEPYTDYTTVKFYISPKYLFIDLERCSAHVNRALDELGDFQFKFDYVERRQYFTPYMKTLMLQ